MKYQMCALAAAAGVATALAAAPCAMAAQTPRHSYEFSGNLADAFGGPSMVVSEGANNAFVGSSVSGGLHFAGNQGPNLTGGFLSPDVYSIEMFFSLEDLDGYRRLIDFKNGAEDNGLYLQGGALLFYFPGALQNAVVGSSPGSIAHLVMTRDAAQNVTAYWNGAAAFAFKDTGGVATLTAPGGIARFFDDDGSEASAGFVDFIRTYDVALTQNDVASLYNGGNPHRIEIPSAVPEPQTWALMVLGFGGTGVFLRTRRRLQLA